MKSFEGIYSISNLGRIRSERNGIILSMWEDKDGYLRVNLKVEGEVYQRLVHRLVGENFISNPYNKKQINHKNGIRNDNRVENLEWCTASENANHKYKVLKYKISEETIEKMRQNSKGRRHSEAAKNKVRLAQSTKVKDVISGIIYSSQKEASEKTGVSQSVISYMCNGARGELRNHFFIFYPV
jgi:hypothetical protein